jgi:hypothetical protein
MKHLTPISILILAGAIIWAADTMRPVRPGDCTELDKDMIQRVIAEHNGPMLLAQKADPKTAREAYKKARNYLNAAGLSGCFSN